MKELIETLGVWGVPTCIITGLLIIFIFMQLTGEIIEWCGKVAPEILKVRKYFKRKREEKRVRNAALATIVEQSKLLQDVQKLLNNVDQHYNADNIAKRDKWMTKVNTAIEQSNNRADKYDATIEQLSKDFAANRELTEEIYVQNSRDRIIDFATRAGDHTLVISREEFKRIFKVYQRYEEFLEAHNGQNGEIETNYSIIQEGYEYRVKHHCFLEDVRADLKNKED